MENLIIACKHIIKREREGLWSPDREVIMCSSCWNKIGELENKHKGDIPIEKLYFVASYCRDCISKILDKE